MPTTTVDGTTLGYTDGGGEGPAVLLVHAFPLHGGMWEPQMEALGGRARLIAVDLKGFGSSDAPEDPAAYTMDSYADELAGVLDHLDLQQVVFCGLSMGGYIGFSFLRRHGDRLAGFVLADTRAEADPPEGIEKRTNQQQQVRDAGASGLIEALAGALLSPKTLANKPDVVERAKKLMDNAPAGFIGALEAMKQRADSTEDLAQAVNHARASVGLPPVSVAEVRPMIGDGVNDVRVCPDDYFHRNFGIPEAGIVDATYLKLREIRLTYQLPGSVASRLGFAAGEVSLIGRNLFLWSKTNHIDPETAFDASNVQGIEFGQYPTARSLGISFTFRR